MRRLRQARPSRASALAGLKAGIGLIDDVDAALAPNNLVVPVTGAQRFQGVTDFHDLALFKGCGFIGTLPAPVNATSPPVVTAIGVRYGPHPEAKSHATQYRPLSDHTYRQPAAARRPDPHHVCQGGRCAG